VITVPAGNPAERNNPFGKAFDAYWQAGWPGIIPVRGKYPPPENYTGATGLWPSYADIFTWGSDPTTAAQNIALRLPEDVLGLDVDAYDGKHGGITLFDCQMLWGELPPTYRSTSRDDGISGIRLFRVPRGRSWPGQLPAGRDRAGSGVELIRWDHRYCVCWPSVHPKTNQVYRWRTPSGVVMINSVPRIDELAELPSTWVDGLSRGEWRAEPKADIPAMDWLLGLSGAEQPMCPRMANLSHRLAGMFTGSGRHDIARDGVLDLIRKAEEGHPGIRPALESVGQSFVLAVSSDESRSSSVAWSEFSRFVDGAVRMVANGRRSPSLGDPCVVPSDPPWSPSEPLNERGRRITQPGPFSSASGQTRADSGPDAPTGTPALDRLVAERLIWRRADRQAVRILDAEENPPPTIIDPTLTLPTFFEQPEDAVPFRIEQLMPTGSRILLAAQHKAGKTTMVCNFIRSMCDGSPFLGFNVNLEDDHRTALLDFEMHPDQLRRWLRAMRIQNPDRAHIMPMIGRARQFDLREENLFNQWVERFRELRITTLIVDCLKPLLDTMDLDEGRETGKFTTPLTALKDAAGIRDLILVHHMGHNNERSRGDSALRGWPEVEWHLVRLSDDPDKEAELDAPRYFKAFGRDVNVQESKLNYDRDTRDLTIGAQQSRNAARAEFVQDKLTTAVLEIVRSSMPTGILRGEVPGQLREAGHRVRTASVVAAIDALAAQKLIMQQLGGQTNRAHRLFTRSE